MRKLFLWLVIVFASPLQAEDCRLLTTLADLDNLPLQERGAFKRFAESYQIYFEAMRRQVRNLSIENPEIDFAGLRQIGEQMYEAVVEILQVRKVPFQRYQTKDGTKIKILPDPGNPLGRLAKRLKELGGPRLVFAPPFYHLKDVSAAYFIEGEIGLSLNVLLDFSPVTGRIYSAFQLTSRELHELRHWHYSRRKSTKIIEGDATPETGQLKDYGTYSEYLSFEEFFTHPYEVFFLTRSLRQMRGKFDNTEVFNRAVQTLEDFQTTEPVFRRGSPFQSIGASRDLQSALKAARIILSSSQNEASTSGPNQWFYTNSAHETAGMIFDRTRKGAYEIVFYNENLWLRFYNSKRTSDLETIFDPEVTERRQRNAMERILERDILPKIEVLSRVAANQAQDVIQIRELTSAVIDGAGSKRDRVKKLEELLDVIERMAQIPGFEDTDSR